MVLPCKPPLLFSFLTLVINLNLPISHQWEPVDPRLIDQTIAASTFQSFIKPHKSALFYNISLPSNLSGIAAAAATFRAGSLFRHGSQINEFTLSPGIVVRPLRRRLVAVYENLGNRSSLVYNMTCYRLVSPVLGLLFYDAATNVSTNELDVVIQKNPILVNFSYISGDEDMRCAAFELDGIVSLSNISEGNMCAVQTQGHFAVVAKGRIDDDSEKESTILGKWKIVLASAGGLIGLVLIAVLAVAMVRVKKNKERMVELERRAYEDEALHMSMVGHVRAPTAPAARTTPAALEDDDYGLSF